MPLDKRHVGADFRSGNVFPADRYKCPECGDAILVGVTVMPYHDPNYDTQDEYLKMTQEPMQ